MAYQDKYSEYLEAVPDLIRRCWETNRRPVIAYTSNLDAIVKWNLDSFNRLVSDSSVKEDPSFAEEETVDNMEDFVRIVSYFAVNGYGGEVEITEGEVIRKLKDYFEIDYGLGGTCAQGAAALGVMGLPVLIHLTDQSVEVMEWLNYPEIESVRDGRRVPLRDCVTGDDPLMHLIMQFEKGDTIHINGKSYEIPLSNRVILDYDQVHKKMPVRQDFLEYLEEHAELAYSYDISGFNAIMDAKVLKRRVEELKKHYQVLKAKNPAMRIYFESAHFISATIRDCLYSELSGFMDIMGMNEEELIDLTRKKEHPVDKEDITSVLSGLDYLLELYPVRGIVMHSKDYALYYGDCMEDIDIELGLTLGNLMSGTRARTGHYGTMEECRESLDLALSPAGLSFADQIGRMKPKHTAVLVPSRYMDLPRCTIGLGDTFVAGMQLCFVK